MCPGTQHRRSSTGRRRTPMSTSRVRRAKRPISRTIGTKQVLRTHTCGEARASLAGKEVTLAGWGHTRRDHGELTFIDLRDRYGLTQVVAHAKENPAAHKALGKARNEWVLRVRGTVRPRPEGTKNPKLPTGEVEVAASEIEVLNESKTPPFYVNEETEVEETLRWKYRYVDLRRR